MNKNRTAKTGRAGNGKSVGSRITFAESHRWSQKPLAASSLLLAALAIARPSLSFGDETNLLINGDFEAPAIQCGLWVSVPEGSGFIRGWNVNIPSMDDANGGCDSFPYYSHSVDVLVNPGGSYVHTGNQALDMAGTASTPGDSIFQDVPTVPGRTYKLKFSTSSNGWAKNNGLTIEWDGVAIATLSTPDQGEWSENTFSVTASSTLTRLRFIDNIAGGQGSLLDTVSLVDTSSNEPPVVSCPPSLIVPSGSVPPAATNAAEFIAQGGVITNELDANPAVVSSDEVSGSCPALITRTYTITDAAGNVVQCQQLITVENLFAADGIVWHPPLARFDAAQNGGRKFLFKLGRTIPVKIRVRGCDGTDLTRNENIIGTLEVLPVSDCGDVPTGDPLPIASHGLGNGNLMEKVGGFLRYNLNTKTLPADVPCFLLKATVINVSTGESLTESLPIQSR